MKETYSTEVYLSIIKRLLPYHFKVEDLETLEIRASHPRGWVSFAWKHGSGAIYYNKIPEFSKKVALLDWEVEHFKEI